MAEESWRQIRKIFDEAMSRKAENRAEFVLRACAGNKRLRAEVESLLASLESADSFLETPAVARVSSPAEDESKKLKKGTRLAHYEIVEKIGAGGMGEVYLARDEKLGRKVAVKILNEKFSGEESNLRRFISEAKTASALNHPNILTIYEYSTSNTVHYIISEYIEGRTLRRLLEERVLNLSEMLDISIQIAAALSAAHESFLIHRDIKPENVMIRPDGLVKVLDFGLAKLVHERNKSIPGFEELSVQENQTTKGMILGTVNYMSPEQAKGLPVDTRTDIFSFGTVLYEMIAGRTPFAGNSSAETFANVIKAEALPLQRFASNVPDELQKIVSKTLRKDPAERYQTIDDVVAELKALRESLTFDGKLERRAAPSADLAGWETEQQEGNAAVQPQTSRPFNAYQAYQLARYHFQQLSPTDLMKSRALLEDAVRFDPDFALAHAALAEQFVLEGITGLKMPAETFPKAKASLQTAMELNLHSAEFYAAAGFVDLVCDWNFAQAKRNLEKSLELNSYYAFANDYLGQVFMFRRQPEKAEFYLRRAVEIQPMGLYSGIMLTIAYFLARNYRRVIEECEKMLALYPRFIIAGWMRCWAFEQTGRAAEAVVEYEKILLEPNGELARRWMGVAYALVGDRAGALDTAAKLVAERQEHYISATHLAALYAALNETERAFSYLEMGLAEHDPWMLWIAADPRFDNVRADARFDQLLHSIGLTSGINDSETEI
jgi:serine/threonine protein kinase